MVSADAAHVQRLERALQQRDSELKLLNTKLDKMKREPVYVLCVCCQGQVCVCVCVCVYVCVCLYVCVCVCMSINMFVCLTSPKSASELS